MQPARSPRRRDADPDASRTAILDAAERVFAERGFDDAALSAIAALAGVAKSLIHHHFGAKEALWREVLQRRFAEFEAIQRAILESEPRGDLADLEQSAREFFDFLVRHPAFVRLHGWANAAGGPLPDTRDLTRLGVARLRALQQAGGLRADVDPAAVLAALFALVEHWFQARASLETRFGPDLPDDARYLETAARLLIDGARR